MKILRAFLATALFFLSTVGFAAKPDPILILVSLDGFRWDYLDRGESPHLQRLAADGVRATGLIPVFPSKTFPSHYSIVTGLYPGHHGIISNNMIDPELEAEFHLHDRAAVEDPRWWGGEPIWVTAERQGVLAATLFWPGSETAVGGVRPTHWLRFDRQMRFEARVDRVLEWLDKPEHVRPRLIALYFEFPNDVSHRHGPDAAETMASIREVDARIGDLVAGIEERGLWDRVQLVVVSDHGMAEVDPERIIYLDRFVRLKEGELFEDGALVQIYPRRGREEKILRALEGADPHLQIYRRAEIPARYRLRDNPRTPPILGVPDVGWEVAYGGTERAREIRMMGGDHGQDPADPRMHGLFVAKGISFRRGLVIDRFESVDIYNLLADILGLEPVPNDGDPTTLRSVLVRSADDSD